MYGSVAGQDTLHEGKTNNLIACARPPSANCFLRSSFARKATRSPPISSLPSSLLTEHLLKMRSRL